MDQVLSAFVHGVINAQKQLRLVILQRCLRFIPIKLVLLLTVTHEVPIHIPHLFLAELIGVRQTGRACTVAIFEGLLAILPIPSAFLIKNLSDCLVALNLLKTAVELSV
jgi:hypothetical protein